MSLKLVFYLRDDNPIEVAFDPQDYTDVTVTIAYLRRNFDNKQVQSFLAIKTSYIRVYEALYRDNHDQEHIVRMDARVSSDIGPTFTIRSNSVRIYSEIRMEWCCTIHVHSATAEKSIDYRSHLNTFEAIHADLLQDNPECIVLDEKYQIVSFDSLYAKPLSEMNWNLMYLHCSYSDLMIPQVSHFVDFDTRPTQAVLDGLKQKLRRDMEERKEQLINQGNTDVSSVVDPVEERSKQFKEALRQNPEKHRSWEDFVEITLHRLVSIHRIYPPSSTLSEAARRVIIDQFIISVCDFMQTTCQIEFKVSSRQIEGLIGWGYLDYKFGKDVIAIMKAAVEDPSEVVSVEAAELGETLSHVKGESLPPSSSSSAHLKEASIQNELQIIEAKEKLVDQGCAQVTAQQHDLSKLEGRSLVRGILSTGTRWDFLKLKHNGGGKPLLSFEGERVLHLVEDTVTSPQRRPSALSTSSVAKEEVEAIMLAIASSMQGDH